MLTAFDGLVIFGPFAALAIVLCIALEIERLRH